MSTAHKWMRGCAFRRQHLVEALPRTPVLSVAVVALVEGQLGRHAAADQVVELAGVGDPGAVPAAPAAPAATVLMRAIISSTALSTGTFSLTTRFIALAQTFSLLRIVNL